MILSVDNKGRQKIIFIVLKIATKFSDFRFPFLEFSKIIKNFGRIFEKSLFNEAVENLFTFLYWNYGLVIYRCVVSLKKLGYNQVYMMVLHRGDKI